MVSHGELVLLVGDAHGRDIHEKFRKILVPGKIHHTVVTGNVTPDQLDFLRSVAPRIHVVRGENDVDTTIPDVKVLTVGGFKIGACHGDQLVPWGDRRSLQQIQRRLGVDVLVTGHTHVSSYYESDGKCIINPGSLTGAPSPLVAVTGDSTAAALGLAEPIPSFVLMSVEAARIDIFTYQLIPSTIGGPAQLKISKQVFPAAAATVAPTNQ